MRIRINVWDLVKIIHGGGDYTKKRGNIARYKDFVEAFIDYYGVSPSEVLEKVRRGEFEIIVRGGSRC